MIKHAKIYKIKIENEIRFIAKFYIDGEEIENKSFLSVKHLRKLLNTF